MTLFKYTPGLAEPETLLKTLMGRKEELRNINRILRNASSGRSLSHAIIIGPKGIGKTHLLRIIYHSVKGDIKIEDLNDYKKDFVTIISPEEEYVDSLDKFILLILKYLKHSDIENIPTLPEEVLKPVTFGDKEKEIAISYIRLFKNRTKKLLLLLIDNINEIIENFTEEDQSRLREILMTSDSILLIGTAPTIFDSITDHDKPLFNFFEIIWLGDLTFEETKKLLEKYAEIEGRNNLIETFGKEESKLRAIYELTGGNPRLILSFYQIITEYDITAIENTFLQMIDELNPYFRERMKDIPAQQREIIDAMAQDTRLLTPTEIASKCLISVNVVNSQIKRLEKLGYIEKAPQKRAKRVLYEIREKLFSIWRQMRVEAGRKRLGFLVNFYQIWFTKEELITQLKKIISDIQEMIMLGKRGFDPLVDKLWYIKESIGIPEISPLLEVLYSSLKREYEPAAKTLMKYLENNPIDYLAWYLFGVVNEALKKYDEAVTAYKKAIETKPDEHMGWYGLGDIYLKLGKYEEAINAYNKAKEINPDNYWTLEGLGDVFLKTQKYKEAIDAYKKATETKPDKYEAWAKLGSAYYSLYEFDEAIEAYQRAIKIKPDYHLVWNILGHLYLTLFGIKVLAGDEKASLPYFVNALESIPYISEKKEIFKIFVLLLKEFVTRNKINIIRIALNEIEKAGQKELSEFLSPYSTLIKYLETKDRDIIERLKREDRVIVEEMLKLLEGKAEEKIKLKIDKGKIRGKMES